MAAPVWVLSVDLQTKTATFQSGMADAAKSARGAFTDIKSGSSEMGRAVGSNMGEARHGVMMLGEEFGVHLPRGLTTFIASLGPVGAAMEAAFPFIAIALGATLLLEHLSKLKEEGRELTQDQVKFGTTAQNVFNELDKKFLQSGIRADELRNDHIGALHKELALINMQSMDELTHSFGELAKAADVVFAKLKVSWYQFGTGSAGAKNALDEFQAKYADLLANNKDSEAADLLKGTRESAQKILDLQNTAKSTEGQKGTGSDEAWAANLKYGTAVNQLKQAGTGYTDKEIQSQQQLVKALNEQFRMEGEIAKTKAQDSANAKTGVANAAAAESASAAKAAAEAKLRIAESSLAADRAAANTELAISHASVDEREAVEMGFADRELQIQLAANHQQIAALDGHAKDYNNQLKALHEKAQELTAQHATAITEIISRGTVEMNAQDLQEMEQGEREKIDATEKGSAARLAAIDAAMKEEQSRGLQNLASYRNLASQRVETVQEMAAEEAKLKADAGKEAADNEEKMGLLALAAAREHQQLMDSIRHVSAAQRVQQEVQASNQEYALKLTAASQEIEALDKTSKDYENKLKAIQDRQKQLIQQHENEVTAIKDKAEIERNTRILSAEGRFNDTIASGMTQLLMGHKSFAATMTSLGNQIVTGMMENALKSVLANDFTKESDAAAAARKAYLAGTHFPFPASVVMGPILGAAAFASVMAFQDGTDSVPGIGRGDRVPAMLEPGEGVVPGGVMDGLRNMARSGSMGGGHTYHIQPHFAPTIHALDSDGVDKVLTKHADKFQKHFENTMRKMNR